MLRRGRLLIACNLGAEAVTVPISGELVLAWDPPVIEREQHRATAAFVRDPAHLMWRADAKARDTPCVRVLLRLLATPSLHTGTAGAVDGIGDRVGQRADVAYTPTRQR